MKDFSYITNSHPAFIENLYHDYVANPDSVEPEMKKFFEGFDFALSSVSNGNGNGAAAVTAKPATSDNWRQEIKIYRLILGYRNKGHLLAKTNPIRERKDRGANLDLGFFGLSEEDLDKTFQAGEIIGLGATTLRKILQHLESVYASHVGIEFKYISDQKKVDWLTNEMEGTFHETFVARKAPAHIGKIERRGHLRKISTYQVCRSKTLFAGRRRNHHCCIGYHHQHGCRS